MTLRNKNILIISPEPWDHLFVSKHHYAIHLAARNNKVYFLGPPTEEEGIQPTDYNNLFIVKYEGFVKGLRFFPTPLQKYFLNKKYNHLQDICKVKFDIIWSFDNSVFFNFSALPNEILSISHMVDLNQDFERRLAAKSANFCFGVSHEIVKRLKEYNPNSFKINHGWSFTKEYPESVEIPGINNIKAVYAGNLDLKYIDWNLLKLVVSTFNNVDFIFAGNRKKSSSDELNNENVFFLGRLSSNKLAHLYQQVDIMILTYQHEMYPEQLTNSHKMMEYLGSGKVVVATWTAEYQKLNEQGLILMSKNHDEFKENFQSAIENLEYHNNMNNQEARKNFALDNTYNKQIERIEKIIYDF